MAAARIHTGASPSATVKSARLPQSPTTSAPPTTRLPVMVTAAGWWRSQRAQPRYPASGRRKGSGCSGPGDRKKAAKSAHSWFLGPLRKAWARRAERARTQRALTPEAYREAPERPRRAPAAGAAGALRSVLGLPLVVLVGGRELAEEP